MFRGAHNDNPDAQRAPVSLESASKHLQATDMDVRQNKQPAGADHKGVHKYPEPAPSARDNRPWWFQYTIVSLSEA